MQEYSIEKLTELALGYLPKLALAIITLIAGLWFIKRMVRLIGKVMDARQLDPSLKPFLTGIARVGMILLLVISVMQMIGVEMTSFIALIGAAGLSVGMALSGSLQHFAGGVLLLIYKPFRVGDVIEAQGQRGIVQEIGMFSTIINTIDNKRIFIPNGPLSTGTIINFTAEDKRRLDMELSVSCRNDIDEIKSIIKQILNSENKVLKEPEPFIGVSGISQDAMNIAIRVWTKTSDLLPAEFSLRETIKKEFDRNGIEVPIQQIEVKMKGS
ncbi:MAG: mechanosensitive ion channel [Ignavibacteria bacterium]|nr:mechanosensitive ion channel [Ignavibacteria bacterium]